MRSASEILGLLIIARTKLSLRGLEEQVEELDARIAELHDLHSQDPDYVPDSEGGVIPADLATSVAARTAARRHMTRAERRQLRRRTKMRPPRKKRWKCCSKPVKGRSRKGKTYFWSTCMYTALGKADQGPRPLFIDWGPKRPKMPLKIGGKTVPRTCPVKPAKSTKHTTPKKRKKKAPKATESN